MTTTLPEEIHQEIAAMGLDASHPPDQREWQRLLNFLEGRLEGTALRPDHPAEDPGVWAGFVQATSTLPAAVLTFDGDEVVLSANAGAESALGCPADGLVGKEAGRLLAEVQRGEQAPLRTLQELASQTVWVVGREDPAASGPLELTTAFVPASQGGWYIGLLRVPAGFDTLTEGAAAAERKYDQVFHQSNDGIIIHDRAGRILDANQMAVSLLGYPPEELQKLNIQDLYPEDMAGDSRAAFERLEAQGRVKFEIDFRRSDGSTFPAEVSSSRFTDGDQLAVQGIFRDISDRKRTGENLRRQAEDLSLINALNQAVNEGRSLDELFAIIMQETKQLFAAHGAMIFLRTKDGQQLQLRKLSIPDYMTQGLEELLGGGIELVSFSVQGVEVYERVLEQGQPARLVSEEELQRLIIQIAGAVTSPMEMDLGSLEELAPQLTQLLDIRSLMVVPLRLGEEVVGLVQVARSDPFTDADVLRLEAFSGPLSAAFQRRRAEETLRESEARYRLVFENAAVGLGVADAQGRLIEFNAAMLKPGGYTRQDIEKIGYVHKLYADPEQRARALELARKHGQLDRFEVDFLHKDGSVYQAFLSLKPITIDGQQHWQAMVEDVTEGRRAATRLRVQAQALEAAANAMLIADRDGVITWINPAFTRLTGYAADEIMGRMIQTLDPADGSTARIEEMWAAVQQGEVWQGELTSRRKNGRPYVEERTVTPVVDQAGQISHFIAVIQDVTERSRAKKRLHKRAQQQELLLDTARHLTASLEFMTVLTQIGMQAKDILNADGCAIYLLDESGEVLQPVVALEPPYNEEILAAPLRVEDSFTGQAVQSRHSMIFNDPQHSEFGQHIPGTPEHETERIIVSPFVVDEEVLGAMCLNRAKQDFSREDLTLVETYATFAATALKNARTVQDLQREVEDRRRAEDELRQRNQELDLLNRVVAAATNTVELEEILEKVCRELALAFDLPQSAATLLVADGTALEVVAEYREDDRPSALGSLIPLTGNPATEWVLANKSPLFVEDAQQDSRMTPVHELMKARGTVSLLILPLIVHGKVWGTIGLDALDRRVFSQAEVDWAAGVATAAAGAIHSARLFAETRRRAEELEAVTEVSLALRKASSREEMLPIILNELLYLMEAEGAALVFRQSRTGQGLIELARGVWARLTGESVPSSDGVAGRVMGGQQAYVGPSMADGSPVDGQLVGVDELACIPLIAQAHAIGVLVVGRAGPFQVDDLRLLNAIGDMVANAIHRESLREQTERRLDRLSALRTIDEAITASVDLRLTLNILLEQVSAQLEVDGATVMLLSGHTQNLEFGAGWGVNSARLSPLQVRLGDGYTGRAALRREVVTVSDLRAAAERDPRAKILHREGFVACYAVPLIAKGQVKGVLEIYQRNRQQVDPEWEDFLGTLAGQAAIAIDNAMLFNDLQRSNTELTLAYDTTLEGWAHALELRDMETEGHSQRVTQMTLRLARAMGMRERELEHVRRGALLHDIGKMGIPDNILLKPGPLTDEEWEIMRRHPTYAYEMLAPISYLRPALEIPYCHHEKWDGTGYPRGLQGEEIPLAARVFAVIDVWDALRSDRPYRDAWEEDRVLDYIRSESGRHFDPDVVERFMGLLA